MRAAGCWLLLLAIMWQAAAAQCGVKRRARPVGRARQVVKDARLRQRLPAVACVGALRPLSVRDSAAVHVAACRSVAHHRSQ